jgi:hypothetical protein
MSIVHSKLAIYGAIDDLVVQARKGTNGSADQAVLTTAAKLLPKATGFGEAGWYRELEQFINRDGVRSPDRRENLTFPTLGEAIAELSSVPPPMSEGEFVQVRNPSAPGGFESQTFHDSAHDPVLARAGYGAFALLKLGEIAGWDTFDANLRDDLKAVLAVAVRSFTALDDPDRVDAATNAITAVVETTDTRQHWTALAEDKVSEEFAQVSKPCFGTLQQVNGKYCSTVVTDCSAADLSVVDIERIIDPMNWSLCSKFFCRMVQNTPNRNINGWSRVQEQIGAECGEYRLITDLIFYKACKPDGSIFMNYDIDPQRSPPDLGYVEVDNGYLYVSPTNPTNDPTQNGVRIRTSKQERVDGLSPCATAALACLMGWADAGKEMLAGTARRIVQAQQAGLPIPKLKPFCPSDQSDPEEQH